MPAWFLFSLLAAFGGWASISLDDLPDYAVARQPLTLTFVVRQHGFTPLNGLEPRVEAEARGQETIAATAARSGDAGRYTATLNLPQAGEWTITIHSGFGNSRVTLLPMAVIAPGGTAPVALAAAERGRRLFAAKGCVACHVHASVPGSGMVAAGPDLTEKRLGADYLRQFLANPAMRTQKMPNLGLSEPAIAALSAFLSGGSGKAE
ncbi:MAG TPA: c-type cytochrome [Gemmatimonadales bacterium]|jgi:mono/diheme cytochrome c family protein